MKMSANVFSTQQSSIINIEQFSQREQVGLMGLIITAEIRVELAELFMDLAGVDSKFI